MKLLVCFQIVNDLDSVMQEDWNRAPEEGLDISYAKKIINFYDEAALEAALRLADEAKAAGVEASVTAVTVDAVDQDFFYKSLFAVGVGRVVRIPGEGDLRFCPYQTAGLLAGFAREGGYDMILMGKQSSIGNNGQTPGALAGLLNMPLVPEVLDLHLRDGGVRVEQQVDGGVRRMTVTAAAVYALGNSLHPYLRVATLREKMAASKCKAECVENPETPGLPKDFPLEGLRRKQSGKTCVFLPGESPEAVADEILARMTQREGRQ